MSWFLKVVRDNYANFNGRAQRKEYWMFILFYILFMFVAAFIDLAILGDNPLIYGLPFGLVGLVFLLGTMLPSLAVAVRRLHDTGKSGWWYLIMCIPIIGGIALLVFMCLDGDEGSNRFGENPKAVV